MGLSIRDIVPRKEIEISELKGKLFCVDAFNILYQFLSTIRQPDGTPLMDNKRRVTSHLSGIFYRNVNLLSEGLKLVYVFDGKAPRLKAATHKEREGLREVSRQRYEEAKGSGDIDAMKRYGSQLIRLDDEMIKESKELLDAMGIGVIQAPSEGEAQASYLNKVNGDVYATVSQDYDSLLFGAPKLVRNLGLARKRKTYSGWVETRTEIIDLQRVLDILEINLDQLICLGILVGTDYNPKGIPGIGQKKALDIVKKYKQPVLIFKHVEEQINFLSESDRFDWKEIFELFHKPNVVNKEIDLGKFDEDKIREILVERHDFSEERVEKQLEKLRKAQDQKKQKGLSDWF